jgi:phage replication initiation protein
MTRPTRSALVLDGSEVKFRLEAERRTSNAMVHVDWVRFTVQRRMAPFPAVDLLFPLPASSSRWDDSFRDAQFRALLAQLPGSEWEVHAQSLELAREVCEALGPEFEVAPEVRKGHDFYKFRWSIERVGVECGWVGFLSSSDSPRQQAQSKTIHVNVYGLACTFARENWRDRMADIVDERKGDITRCDLALDFFEGLRGGIERVRDDYKAGLCDVGGRHPKCNQLGDWTNDGAGERSFYIGSKEAGKQTNAYEKGDQLFGVEAGSSWLRVELRYGNKLRELPSAMLRRPDDFFACASEWHASVLAEAGVQAGSASVPCRGRLPIESVRAEVSRVTRWLKNTASAACAIAFSHMGDGFLEVVTARRVPGRLRGFKASEIASAFAAMVPDQPRFGGASPVPA